MPGPEIPGGWAGLSQVYDHAVLTADPSDVSIRSSTRVHDFVNRGREFDGLYVYRPVLAACRRIIGRAFKLSTLLARTLEPGARAQPLHLDVKRGAEGWPLVVSLWDLKTLAFQATTSSRSRSARASRSAEVLGLVRGPTTAEAFSALNP
jgi:hypothetical protein